ncbi:hypothetical protein EMIT0P294_140156 [Pseudomonas sp. IT-P294]
MGAGRQTCAVTLAPQGAQSTGLLGGREIDSSTGIEPWEWHLWRNSNGLADHRSSARTRSG